MDHHDELLARIALIEALAPMFVFSATRTWSDAMIERFRNDIEKTLTRKFPPKPTAAVIESLDLIFAGAAGLRALERLQ